MHHFIIYFSPILDDEVRPYRRIMTFKVTRKAGTALPYFKLQTFGSGCSTYNDNYGFLIPPQNEIFSVASQHPNGCLRSLAPSVCQLATT